MIVYGACWQDTNEPWGWEPETLWWTREAAEAAVGEAVARTRAEYLRRGFSEGEADAFSREQHGVREYEIQGSRTPPAVPRASGYPPGPP